MKKLIVLFILSSFFLSGCNFCNKLRVSEDIATMVGAGLSGVKGGDSWETKAGVVVGGEARVYPINETSGLYTGVNLSLQGAAYTESYNYDQFDAYQLKSTSDEGFSGKVNLAYINIPFLYRYQSPRGFYGEVGLQPSFLISAKDKFDGGDSNDYKDAVKGFDLGLPIGAGYRVNDKISLGVRGIYGLTNFDDTGSSEADHNWLILALFRYNIELNK